jgi:hypothetical protein
MKKCVAVLLVASVLSLDGCCSTQRDIKWEYKVVRFLRGDANHAEGPEAVREGQETLLNDMGKEGWMLVSQADGRIFYFTRAVR